MKLKFRNVNNLTAARYIAAAGADYITFNFDKKNENFISVLKAQEIKNWLAGCKFSGEFSGNDMQEIDGIKSILNLDAVELPLEKFLLMPAQTDTHSINIEKKFLIADASLSWSDTIAERLTKENIYIVLRGNNFSANEKNIAELCKKNKVFFGMNFSENDVENIHKLYNPYGLEFYSPVEEKIGFSSFENIENILEEIKMLSAKPSL